MDKKMLKNRNKDFMLRDGNVITFERRQRLSVAI